VQSPHQRLLLVSKNRVPDAVQTELRRLKPTHVYIVGGTGVISQAVEDWMWTLPSRPFVERIAGADRYETSLALVRAVWGEPAPGGVNESTIVTGRNYPDSLAASAATTTVWRGGQGPLLLVDGKASSVPMAVRNVLAKHGTIETRVVGGSGAVSDAIMRQLPNPVRLGGADRYETAVALNTYVFGAHDVAYLATGRGFADALAASGVAAATKASLYLAEQNCVPRSALDAMADQGVKTVRLLGGPTVLGSGVAKLTPCT
jgi:putative cell wall-binding protein